MLFQTSYAEKPTKQNNKVHGEQRLTRPEFK